MTIIIIIAIIILRKYYLRIDIITNIVIIISGIGVYFLSFYFLNKKDLFSFINQLKIIMGLR